MSQQQQRRRRQQQQCSVTRRNCQACNNFSPTYTFVPETNSVVCNDSTSTTGANGCDYTSIAGCDRVTCAASNCYAARIYNSSRVDCTGERACVYATIGTSFDPVTSVRCVGERSCASADLYASETVECHSDDGDYRSACREADIQTPCLQCLGQGCNDPYCSLNDTRCPTNRYGGTSCAAVCPASTGGDFCSPAPTFSPAPTISPAPSVERGENKAHLLALVSIPIGFALLAIFHVWTERRMSSPPSPSAPSEGRLSTGAFPATQTISKDDLWRSRLIFKQVLKGETVAPTAPTATLSIEKEGQQAPGLEITLKAEGDAIGKGNHNGILSPAQPVELSYRSGHPKTDITLPTTEICEICLEDYVAGDDVAYSRNDQCHHVFHKNCLLDWLGDPPAASDEHQHGNPCPVCRHPFCPSSR